MPFHLSYFASTPSRSKQMRGFAVTCFFFGPGAGFSVSLTFLDFDFGSFDGLVASITSMASPPRATRSHLRWRQNSKRACKSDACDDVRVCEGCKAGHRERLRVLEGISQAGGGDRVLPSLTGVHLQNRTHPQADTLC